MALRRGGPTRTEVLITTALKSGDRYLAGSADVYYIERDDAVLYQAPPPLPWRRSKRGRW